jgi:hypothetical protein
MTSMLRRFAAASIALLAFAFPASATTFSVDYTDLWYNPAESGWGVNISQQGNTFFATLFVYGPDSTPRWYVGPEINASSTTAFAGALYRSTGPYFGAAWTGVGAPIVVGNMSFVFNTPVSGTLQYSVDGVTVTKQIQRQTFRGNNLAGNYLGGLTAQGTSCGGGVSNGPILIFDTMTVTHNTTNQAMSIQVRFFTGTQGVSSQCTFAGQYSQNGKLGSLSGNWSCTFGANPGNTGTFNISELDMTQRGWNGRFSGSDQYCQYTGNFGGVRDVI